MAKIYDKVHAGGKQCGTWLGYQLNCVFFFAAGSEIVTHYVTEQQFIACTQFIAFIITSSSRCLYGLAANHTLDDGLIVDSKVVLKSSQAFWKSNYARHATMVTAARHVMTLCLAQWIYEVRHRRWKCVQAGFIAWILLSIHQRWEIINWINVTANGGKRLFFVFGAELLPLRAAHVSISQHNLEYLGWTGTAFIGMYAAARAQTSKNRAACVLGTSLPFSSTCSCTPRSTREGGSVVLDFWVNNDRFHPKAHANYIASIGNRLTTDPVLPAFGTKFRNFFQPFRR